MDDRAVTVLTAGTPGLLVVAKSVLDDAGIPYRTRGEGFQNLYAAGAVEVQVASVYAERARELLADL
ncbi:MAG: DUF2007 domain-containing protein [bacterium]|nr:DUF2007 domain-containing protein [bacterium]